MTTAKFTIPTHIRGTTFDGFAILLKRDNLAVDFSSVLSAELRLKTAQATTLAKIYEIGLGLSVDTDNHYRLIFDEQIIDLPPNIYYYDLLITFEDGVRKVFLEGTWLIDRGLI
jgi:hypothetical protein